MKIDQYLNTCLTTMRRAGTPSEARFVQWLCRQIEDLGRVPEVDGYGNIWVVDGYNTLLTCHTDTVCDPKLHFDTQEIAIDMQGMIMLVPHETNPTGRGQCLGADDGAGVAILLNLMKHGAPVDFVFFREEEIGGRGSDWTAGALVSKLKSYSHAVAFDRRGTRDVITHQAGTRCCSDAFASALAAQLGMNYAPSDAGVFTDTANLIEIIPECTNISVGYYSEHGATETLDYTHWCKLLEALKRVDWRKLPAERDPSVIENLWQRDYYSNYCYGVGGSSTVGSSFGAPSMADDMDYISQGGYEAALEIAMNEPERAAEILEFLLCSDTLTDGYGGY